MTKEINLTLASRSWGLFNSPSVDCTPLIDLLEHFNTADYIPKIPVLERDILEGTASVSSEAVLLGEIIKGDVELAVDLVRWAHPPSSALHNAPKSPSIGPQDGLISILEILGFEGVKNLALGLTALWQFSIPEHHSSGNNAFWRHAVYSAGLMQTLAGHLSPKLRPNLSTLKYKAAA